MAKNKEKTYAGIYYIKVLDTNYDIYIDNDPTYLDKADAYGLTDNQMKVIHIFNMFKVKDMDKKVAEIEFKRVLRHELLHAFIYECGLTGIGLEEEAWPISESMIDFFSVQFEKLDKLFNEAYNIVTEIKSQL